MSQEAAGSTPRYLREAERLRSRFPGIWHASLVDKDFDHLTSDRRAHGEARCYFLGEICFTSAFGDSFHPSPLPGARPVSAGAGAGNRPGLVTRRQTSAGAAVELAPATHPRLIEGRSGAFTPVETEDLRPGTCFDLLYRRPVPRAHLGAHFATLTGAEKQRLATELDQVRRNAGKGGQP